MGNLVAAAVFFVGIHFLVSGTRWRDRLVEALGEQVYRGLFSLASAVGIVWLAIAYGRAPYANLWGQLLMLKPLAAPLLLLAFLFIVIGLTTPSPTAAGMEGRLARDEPVRGMLRITRHPFLWGVALWALVHLVVNGDLASFVLFGSLLVLVLGGTVSIDAKRRRVFGEHWDRFARATSNVPFAAIAAGRNWFAPALREIGLWRPVLAVVVYGAVVLLHARLFGVPAH